RLEGQSTIGIDSYTTSMSFALWPCGHFGHSRARCHRPEVSIGLREITLPAQQAMAARRISAGERCSRRWLPTLGPRPAGEVALAIHVVPALHACELQSGCVGVDAPGDANPYRARAAASCAALI